MHTHGTRTADMDGCLVNFQLLATRPAKTVGEVEGFMEGTTKKRNHFAAADANGLLHACGLGIQRPT